MCEVDIHLVGIWAWTTVGAAYKKHSDGSFCLRSMEVTMMKSIWRDPLRLAFLVAITVIFAASMLHKQYPAITGVARTIGVPLFFTTGIAIVIRKRNKKQ